MTTIKDESQEQKEPIFDQHNWPTAEPPERKPDKVIDPLKDEGRRAELKELLGDEFEDFERMQQGGAEPEPEPEPMDESDVINQFKNTWRSDLGVLGNGYKLFRDTDYAFDRGGRCKKYTKSGEKKMWLGRDSRGRAVIYINSKKYLLHRIVAELFVERQPMQNVVKHIDGDVRNNKASNLMWV